MGVSKNSGTPKWMVYNGKPYLNGWFGGITIFGNTHICIFHLYSTRSCCVASSSLWQSSVKQRVPRFEELNFSDNHVGDEGKWKIWRSDICEIPGNGLRTIFLSFLIHEGKLGKWAERRWWKELFFSDVVRRAIEGAECLSKGLKNSHTLKRCLMLQQTMNWYVGAGIVAARTP